MALLLIETNILKPYLVKKNSKIVSVWQYMYLVLKAMFIVP